MSEVDPGSHEAGQPGTSTPPPETAQPQPSAPSNAAEEPAPVAEDTEVIAGSSSGPAIDSVAPDLEHIVSSGVLEDPNQSMDSLREAVKKAREASGVQREALPPGFDDAPTAQSDDEDDVLAVEASLTAGQKRKAQDDAGDSSKKEKLSIDAPGDTEDPEAKSMLDRAVSAIEGTSAAANGTTNAPSQSDSSDSDSDSSDSPDSDDSDSDSEDDDAAAAAAKSKPKKGTAEDSDDDIDFTEATPATKHEIVAPEVELPSIQQLSPEDLAMIRPLGKVHSIVSSVVVVEQDVTRKANQSADEKAKARATIAPVDSNGQQGEQEGEYSVLDTESLLCFEDGKVLGLVFETFGSIHSPMYSIRFASPSAVDKEVIKVGKPTYYLPSSSTYVLTRVLKSMKGSDASNVYDEEVGEEEQDFSDDEAEAEARRRVKRSKAAKKNGENGPVGQGKGAKQGGRGPPQRLGQPFEGARQGLPARPRAALPAKPNFDYDVPPSDGSSMAGPTPAGRRILSYDDAGAGGDAASAPVPIEMAARGQWAGKAQSPVARGRPGVAGLPPKPSGLPPSPHLNQLASSTLSSPGRAQLAAPFTPNPQLDASTFGSPSTAHQGYTSQATPPFQSTPTLGSSSSPPPLQYPATTSAEAAAAPGGGHYNPRFAGFWPQQTGQWGQPATAQGYGQTYHGYNYPGAQQGQSYGGQYAGAYAQQGAASAPYGQAYGAAAPSYYGSYGASTAAPGSPQGTASSFANAYPGYGYGGGAAPSYDPTQPSVSNGHASPAAHYPGKPQ